MTEEKIFDEDNNALDELYSEMLQDTLDHVIAPYFVNEFATPYVILSALFGVTRKLVRHAEMPVDRTVDLFRDFLAGRFDESESEVA